MQVKFKRLVGPEWMVPAMRVTRGKDMYDNELPSLATWYKMILSEHSSDRAVKYRIYIEDIPTYTHVHLIRHHVGVEPHVCSQRDDDGTEQETNRDSQPQGALINMFLDLNVQALVNISRKRLCYKAHRTAQEVIHKLKVSLIYQGDEYDRVLGKLLMTPCSWYSGICSEPKPCGRVVGVRKLTDLHKSVLDDVS